MDSDDSLGATVGRGWAGSRALELEAGKGRQQREKDKEAPRTYRFRCMAVNALLLLSPAYYPR